MDIRVNKSDYYYGAFLSKILDNGCTPALLTNDANRGVYKITTDSGEYIIYMKYLTNHQDDLLWNFSFTKDNLEEIKEYVEKDEKLMFGFICSYESLLFTELGLCDLDEFKRCVDLDCKNEDYKRLSILKVPYSPYLRFYGSELDREDSLEIERTRINNL